ncbi:MAG: ABC transporter substrate-binding protein [Anaerolineae bacterium]
MLKEAVASLGILLLAGCDARTGSTSVPAPTQTLPQAEPVVATAKPEPTVSRELAGKIVIMFWTDPKQLEANPKRQIGGWGTAYVMIKQWAAEHPKVEIEWAPVPSGPDYESTFATQLLAGTAPDLVAFYSTQRPDIIEPNMDLLYDFAEDLKKPNPYGSYATWEEEFPLGTALEGSFWVSYIPKGARLFLGNTETGNKGVTAFFYNQEILEQAGVARPPETWTELKAACKRIAAKGVTPNYMDEMRMHWSLRLISEQLMGPVYEMILKAWGANEVWGAITPEMWAWAVKTGVLKATDPRFLETPRLIKDLLQWSNSDWLAPEGVDYFLTKRVAMAHDGIWMLGVYNDAEDRDFEYGTFYLPAIDTDASVYATGAKPRRFGSVAGGGTGNSWVVPKTVVDRGTLPIVLDLLQYLTARPSNDYWCSKQYPPCVPPGRTINDVIADKAELARLRGFYEPPMEKDTVARDLEGSGIMDAYYRLAQTYFLDKTSLEKLGEDLQTEWMRQTDKAIQDNPGWRVSDWPKA